MSDKLCPSEGELLAFADADLAGHEEYFVRKVSQSLGLSRADLIETKILAREAFLG